MIPWIGAKPSSMSPKFLVASICDLPDVINCQFHEFAVALVGTRAVSFANQQSGIGWRIQLLTPNNFGRDLKTYLFAGHSSVSAY